MYWLTDLTAKACGETKKLVKLQVAFGEPCSVITEHVEKVFIQKTTQDRQLAIDWQAVSRQGEACSLVILWKIKQV